jgi:hypothetical protein
LFLAATLSTLAALLPVTGLASTLTASVAGVQYAVGGLCTDGTTSSFAGVGSVPAGGQVNAVFNTTICHTPITDAGAMIRPGGSFQLTSGSQTFFGAYASGFVGPGAISGRHLCKEVFPVTATLAPSGNIAGGSATGVLTHYGLRTADGGCHAYAATIAGVATLVQ